MWAKLQSLVEGARLASKELWGRSKKKAVKRSVAKTQARRAVRAAPRKKRAA
jgi:hypothetical protein